MRYQELLTNEEFLGFVECWKKEYAMPFALEDWFAEKGYEELAKVAKWVSTVEGKYYVGKRNSAGLYPWTHNIGDSYYWTNARACNEDSNYLPIDPKISIDRTRFCLNFTKDHPFEKAILIMFNLMVENEAQRITEE